MPIENIVEAIDQEISRLQQVRTLLAGDSTTDQPAKSVGRPKGSTNQAKKKTPPAAPADAHRNVSDEGRARIAAAQKARWAVQRKNVKPAKKSVKQAAPAKKAEKPVPAKVARKNAPAKRPVAAPKAPPVVPSEETPSAEA